MVHGVMGQCFHPSLTDSGPFLTSPLTVSPFSRICISALPTCIQEQALRGAQATTVSRSLLKISDLKRSGKKKEGPIDGCAIRIIKPNLKGGNIMEDRAEKRVKVVFTFEVSTDNQPEYLKVTGEKIKPFWESHGCQSYSIWQVTDNPTAFVKEMVFEDRGAMEKSMALNEAKSVKELFYSFAGNISRKVYLQKI
jgi:quinol monooxygenase YgiN